MMLIKKEFEEFKELQEFRIAIGKPTDTAKSDAP
jgi:hypothetical protein